MIVSRTQRDTQQGNKKKPYDILRKPQKGKLKGKEGKREYGEEKGKKQKAPLVQGERDDSAVMQL
jgi:hypothetical protein